MFREASIESRQGTMSKKFCVSAEVQKGNFCILTRVFFSCLKVTN